jgi:hypothetical protein
MHFFQRVQQIDVTGDLSPVIAEVRILYLRRVRRRLHHHRIVRGVWCVFELSFVKCP